MMDGQQPDDTARKLEAAGWHHADGDGFVGHVGGLWRREAEDGPEFAFLATPIHANRNGVVHGGMLMTFVDQALGETARVGSGAVRSATVSLTHQFLGPVQIGDLVEIAPRIVKTTTRMVFVSGTAHVGGAPVAEVQAVFRISHSPV